ncbi:hypothetical protein TIFTF001_011169 [Ficus carica]|uniref:Uncharacterized protein n=1 Tax=Ficus carica TaxID=3494 RepID=A0AA87ZZG8_FICCA|nr:hypothetical protein TIFTF001_011169 [Ficus carica]
MPAIADHLYLPTTALMANRLPTSFVAAATDLAIQRSPSRG